jgi:hypothetical protein
MSRELRMRSMRAGCSNARREPRTAKSSRWPRRTSTGIEAPEARSGARAALVCGQHGWWQECSEIGAPGYDPFSSDGANYNLVIGNVAFDPVSGSVPLRAYLCQVSRAE